ncbi:MAG: hypothetical protein KC620_16355, partial [Myxococcales bacterium]|nr:hypothetical protein [Myxococcales bacterium]
QEELAERVAYAGLFAVARMATVIGPSLRSATRLLQTSYFHALRRRGQPVKGIAEKLEISARQAANLSKALKETFLDAERAVSLPRRIEFLIWAEPLGEGRIRQALGDVPGEDVRAALDQLIAEGRVEAQPGRTPTYAALRPESRLPRDTWLARVDALEHLLANVGDAIFARFFRGDARAFARTVSLRVRREDEAALRALYEDVLWPALAELDARARDDAGAAQINLSVVYAPREYVEGQHEEQS